MTTDLLPHAFFTLSDGARLRYARFDPMNAPRGTVLAIPGRREFIEKKFAEIGQPLLDKGYRLIVVELRNQGLSSRFLSGSAQQRDHIEDFATHLDDLRAFFRAVIAPLPAPLIVHGHSLGAHVLLRWLAEDRPPVAGAFVTSPMLALAGAPAHLTAYGVSWLGVRLFGHATDYAPLQYDYNDKDRAFADNPLTNDPARFEILNDYFTAYPAMTVGGVTWGWLLAALRSMHIAHARHYLARIAVPVLALAGDQDRVTPPRDTTPCLSHIPHAQTHILPDALHDIMNEAAPIRAEAWRHIDDFLKTITP